MKKTRYRNKIQHDYCFECRRQAHRRGKRKTWVNPTCTICSGTGKQPTPVPLTELITMTKEFLKL